MRTPARGSKGDGLDWLGRGAAVGAWIVDAELGRGGMSTVYAVTHGPTGRRGALKLARLDPSDGPLPAACFLLEARCAIAARHPGTVEIYEVGMVADRPYLVMEPLAGRTLGELADERPGQPIDAATSLAILIELCGALAAAHAAGVVHRDLKLDNVFVLDAPVAGRRAVLLDWGLAIMAGEDDPWAGLVAGTPQYVAPEQARGLPVGPATDVYALGVLTYRLFTGRLPFDAGSAARILRMQCRSRLPRARRGAAIPCEVDDVMRAMMAKRAADRPSLSEVTSSYAAAAARLAR